MFKLKATEYNEQATIYITEQKDDIWLIERQEKGERAYAIATCPSLSLAMAITKEQVEFYTLCYEQ